MCRRLKSHVNKPLGHTATHCWRHVYCLQDKTDRLYMFTLFHSLWGRKQTCNDDVSKCAEHNKTCVPESAYDVLSWCYIIRHRQMELLDDCCCMALLLIKCPVHSSNPCGNGGEGLKVTRSRCLLFLHPRGSYEWITLRCCVVCFS